MKYKVFIWKGTYQTEALEALLEDGWTIINSTAQHVATGHRDDSFGPIVYILQTQK